jgi:hypothetical protein
MAIEWNERKSTPPDAEEVTARLFILRAILMKATRTPPPDLIGEYREGLAPHEWKRFLRERREEDLEQIEQLKRDGLWSQMTKVERNFMKAKPLDIKPQELIDASWIAESATCLLWALGYVPEMPPYDEELKSDAMNRLPGEAIGIPLKKATLRSSEEIEKQRDIAERWHWRSRTRVSQASKGDFELADGRKIGELLNELSAKAAADGEISTPINGDFPAFGKAYSDLTEEEFSQAASIALERHRALNWLCGFAPGNRWEKTRTDT